MANALFRDRLNVSVQACLAEAMNCSATHHSGMVGTIREILLEKILLPLLPEGVRAGTGKVTDSNGNLSSQTDVIIYDRRSVPPLMYDERLGVFPIESVYYTIEVKSLLSASELEDSIKKGQGLRALSGPQPHSVLFAFSSDLTASMDSQRIIQRQKDLLVPLPINVFCVVGREYGYWDKVWKTFVPSNQHDEIAALVVGIMNTLVAARHLRQPALESGPYFFPTS